jgi:N-acetylmuramoyl-L-alanine amidase
MTRPVRVRRSVPNVPSFLHGWFGRVCILVVLVCLIGSQPDVPAVMRTTASHSASEAASPSTRTGVFRGSQPPASPADPNSTASEQVTGPDYPGATWVPAVSTNFTVANRPHDYPVDMIVIHDTEVPFAKAIQIFQDPTRQVSANYVVSARGQIAQTVLEKDIAWHAGNWDYNTRAIGIEHEGYAYMPGSYTKAEYQAGAQLAASICSRWGVPMDRTHVIGHNQVPDPDQPGLFGGFAHRTDPGPYWNWNYFIGLAASYASALPSPPQMMVDPVAINGLNSATVTWQVARSCHLPILGYTVVAQPGNLSSYLPATATTATFDNLQPGISYTFTVTATNADGHDSLTSNAVIPGRCNAVQVNAAPDSPQPYGSTVLLYGTSAGCAKPLFAFALLAPGSTEWTIVQPYSSTSAFIWSTTGHASGTYFIRLLVRDADSPGTYKDALGTYDDYKDVMDTVTPTACNSVTVSAVPPGTAMSGDTITIAATAAGCPTPQYEFWMRPATQKDWQLVQSYGPSALYIWDSLGEPAGTVYVAVRARDSSRGGAYDAVAVIWYSVTTTPRRAPGQPRNMD